MTSLTDVRAEHDAPALRSPARPTVSAQERMVGPTALLALQRAAGNHAVARLFANAPTTPAVQRCVGTVHVGCSCADEQAGADVQRSADAMPTVQWAERPELISALKSAVSAEKWQDAAVRLNGFDKDDLASLAGELTVGQAANTFTAVQKYLAGWPREQEILHGLAAVGSEVGRIAAVYHGYAAAIATSDWTAAANQLNAMSPDDLSTRIHELNVAELVALDGAAAIAAPRVRRACDAEVARRGGPVPFESLPPGTQIVGAFAIGGRVVLDVAKFEAGGQVAFRSADIVAQGTRATVGAAEVAEDAVVAVRVAGTAGGGGAGVGAAAAGGAGLVPTVGLVLGAVAVGAGIALSPLAIVHAATVLSTLGEYGGTLPPGGTGGGGGGPDTCRDCANGTTAEYGGLDSRGRAMPVRARIKGRPSPGSPPQADPAGWGQHGSGSGGTGHSGQGRAHLLAQSLGGLGIAENLVTFDQSVNVRMFSAVESVILNYTWTTPDHCVSIESQPLYEGDALVPYAIVIKAVDDCTGAVVVVDTIANRQLH